MVITLCDYDITMKTRSFTLLELLISLTIFGAIFAGIFWILYVSDMNWSSDGALLELQQESRRGIEGMIREIRKAKPEDVIITNGGQNIQFRVPIDITVSPIIYSQDIIYSLNSNQIIREHPANTTSVLANDVTSLNFCCWSGGSCGTDCTNANVLQVQMGTQKTAKQRLFSFSLMEKVRLRNE